MKLSPEVYRRACNHLWDGESYDLSSKSLGCCGAIRRAYEEMYYGATNLWPADGYSHKTSLNAYRNYFIDLMAERPLSEGALGILFFWPIQGEHQDQRFIALHLVAATLED